MKRQRRGEEASDGGVEDEEERMAQENLRRLQEMAEKAMRESSDKASSSSPSSASSSACLRSSWQQLDRLMVYTAAGVKGSNKVGAVSEEQSVHFVCLSL